MILNKLINNNSGMLSFCARGLSFDWRLDCSDKRFENFVRWYWAKFLDFSHFWKYALRWQFERNKHSILAKYKDVASNGTEIACSYANYAKKAINTQLRCWAQRCAAAVRIWRDPIIYPRGQPLWGCLRALESRFGDDFNYLDSG